MRAALLACAALLATPAAAGAAEQFVSMPGKFFSPAQLTVVSGDEVVFRNSDFSGDEHDVRAVDGGFATGRLARFGSFRWRFDALGVHDYVCGIHPGMSGSVAVAAALLEAPAEPGLAGEPLVLRGRAPAGAADVRVERLGADGAWTAEAHAAAGADGAFAVTVHPTEPGSYRAATAAGAGPPVEVPVVTGLHVATDVRRGGRTLRVRVHPPPAGVFAVLERYSRERFTWRRAARVRVDARGRARFRLAGRARGLARVVLERGRGGVPLAAGDPLRLPSGRPGHDPTAHDVPLSGAPVPAQPGAEPHAGH